MTALILIALVVSTRLEVRRRERIQRSVIEKMEAAIEKRFITLTEKRTRLVQEEWSEEIRYFLIDQLRPSLSREERYFLHENFAALALAIERAVEAAMIDQTTAGPSGSTAVQNRL
jgi:hypothetical protein